MKAKTGKKPKLMSEEKAVAAMNAAYKRMQKAGEVTQEAFKERAIKILVAANGGDIENANNPLYLRYSKSQEIDRELTETYKKLTNGTWLGQYKPEHHLKNAFKEAGAERDKIEKAATKIQALVRGRRSRKETAEERSKTRKKRDTAAAKIQALVRGSIARKVAMEERKKALSAVFKAEMSEMEFKKQAIEMIVNAQAGKQKELREQLSSRLETDRAVNDELGKAYSTLAKKGWRGARVAQVLANKPEFYLSQAFEEADKVAADVKKSIIQNERETAASPIIQRAWRSSKARVQVAELAAKRHEKTVEYVLEQFKDMKERSDNQINEKDFTEKAISIIAGVQIVGKQPYNKDQKRLYNKLRKQLTRNAQVKSGLSESYKLLNGRWRSIGELWRGEDVKTHLGKVLEVAETKRKEIRKELGAVIIEEGPSSKAKKAAAATIQRAARGYLARKEVAEKREERRKRMEELKGEAASVIQAAWRRTYDKKKPAERLLSAPGSGVLETSGAGPHMEPSGVVQVLLAKSNALFEALKQRMGSSSPKEAQIELGNLDTAQKIGINQEITEEIKRGIEQEELRVVSPQIRGSSAEYDVGEGRVLTRTKSANGMFKFSPPQDFTGIVKVERWADESRTTRLKDSTDFIQYVGGEVVLVVEGGKGVSRIESLDQLIQQAKGEEVAVAAPAMMEPRVVDPGEILRAAATRPRAASNTPPRGGTKVVGRRRGDSAGYSRR